MNSRIFRALILVCAFAVFGLADSRVNADIIFFSPDSATATNTSNSAFSPTHLINLSGISSTPVTLSNIGSILHNDGVSAEVWRGAASALAITLTFDFNTAQEIDYVGLWQGVDHSQGVRDFNLRFWDGSAGTGNQIGGVFSDVLDTGAGGVGSIPLHGRSFDVGTRSGVNSFTMEITSIALPISTVHLGEVMVTTNAVPEPSSLFLLLLVGGTCCSLRLRHAKRHFKTNG